MVRQNGAVDRPSSQEAEAGHMAMDRRTEGEDTGDVEVLSGAFLDRLTEHECDFMEARTGTGHFKLKAIYKSNLGMRFEDVYIHPDPHVTWPKLGDCVGPNLKVGTAKWNTLVNTSVEVNRRLDARDRVAGSQVRNILISFVVCVCLGVAADQSWKPSLSASMYRPRGKTPGGWPRGEVWLRTCKLAS